MRKFLAIILLCFTFAFAAESNKTQEEDIISITNQIQTINSQINIIICGHSDCGGCAALYVDEKKLKNTPNVRNWIRLIEPIKREVLKFTSDDPAKMAWLTERLNVINSIENIMTYPNVKEEYESGKLQVYGWHYIIETGEIFSYDLKEGTFKLLADKRGENA